MKKTLIIGFFILSGSCLFAQQLPHFSQYYLNDFLINPAVAGTKNYFEGKSSHRYQWEGITDAPRTYTLSINGPIKSQKMGLGGYIFTDIVGPTRRTGFSASYAYHLKLNDAFKLSLGLSAGVVQFTIDGSKINLRDQGDAILSNGVQSVLLPDAGFGLYLYHSDFYIGVSAPQLLNSKVEFFEKGENPTARLPTHFFATAGYKYKFSDNFQLEPSVFVKYVSPVPIQFEGSLRLTYKEQLSLAGTYRDGDALSISLSYLINNSFTIAYAYDFTTSNIGNFSNGSHEVLVGVRFYRKKKLPKSIQKAD